MAGRRSFSEEVSRITGPSAPGTDPSKLLSSVLPQSLNSLNQTLTELTSGFAGLTATSQAQLQALLANTQAITQNTVAHGTAGIGGTLEQIGSGLLGNVLSSFPLISGLLSLFGGGGSQSPPPLVRFSLPPQLNMQAANAAPASGGLPAADYSQSGTPRSFEGTDALTPQTSTQPASAPNITIQVQAIDSRSFIDRSHDIAQAVREAMLDMHSLNDVISDL